MCYDGNYPRFMLYPKESCLTCSETKNEYMKLTPEQIVELTHKHYGNDGIAGLKMEVMRAGETTPFRNNVIYWYYDAKQLLSTFDIEGGYAALGEYLRKRAKITDKKLRHVKKKQSDLLAEAKALQYRSQAIS